MGRVIVVGSINVDLVVRVPHLPRAGETVIGGEFASLGGGKGANQAAAAAVYGSKVVLVGAVGDDDHGGRALAELADDGVDVSAVDRVAGTATGIALIVVDTAGNNQIAVASGANAAVDGSRVAALLARVALLPDDVLLTGFELPDAAVLAAVAAARAAGARSIVNPAPARPLAPELLAANPILTPNELEAIELTGTQDARSAAPALVALTHAPVVVSLGERGALLLSGSEAPSEVSAPPVHAVDSTGAGDTLNGILAAELATGGAIGPSARRAVVGASLSTTALGARGRLPSAQDIDGLLRASREAVTPILGAWTQPKRGR